jgi:hypothetical protein
MFCGLYNTILDTSKKSEDLFEKTYKKIGKALFKQPFLYDNLSVDYWTFERDTAVMQQTDSENLETVSLLLNPDKITRWDIINREQDLKLFIKVPSSCKSSIVILEGDYRHFNDYLYIPESGYEVNKQESWRFKNLEYFPEKTQVNSTQDKWKYLQNHSIVNFGTKEDPVSTNSDEYNFIPISKLQLLAFNTGESYPFADKLVEYLVGSVITPIDKIPDNIKRAQKVMKQNQHNFRIDGLWEDKMQKIIYDYIINSGPISYVAISTQENSAEYGTIINPNSYHGTFEYVLLDKHSGYHPRLGHNNKSTLYDVLGYIDKDAEKWYASWKVDKDQAKVSDTIQHVDIYDGLYDI